MSLKKPLFALVTLVALLLLVELMLAFLGVQKLAAESDSFAGFSQRVPLFEKVESDSTWRTPARAVKHSFNYQQFADEKRPEDLRIFVLGGSSAYGFPWGASQAFPAALERALQHSLPDREVQAINAAGMSYGSLRVRLLSYELLTHNPDMLVIYSGHNEFVERDLHQRIDAAPLPSGLRAVLHRWRLFSALSRLLQPSEPEPPSAQESLTAGELTGLDAAREYSTDVVEAERLEAVSDYKENLRAVVRAAKERGVPVVLCSMPSNARGWRPNQTSWPKSMSAAERAAMQRAVEGAQRANDAGDANGALEFVETIEAMTLSAAHSWYEKGRALNQLNRHDEASEAFVRARDLDGQPGRAISAINAAIREVAESEGALFVDVQASFRDVAKEGTPGFDLFEDYVHPKPSAHLLIAREIWRATLAAGWFAAPATVSDDEFLNALALPQGFDFTSEADAPDAAQTAQTAPLLFNLAVVLENQGRFEEAMERYRRCVELDPGYFVARTNLGRLLRLAGRPAEAAEEYNKVLQVQPTHLNSAIGLGESLRELGMLPEAEATLERAVAIDESAPAAWNALGSVKLIRGKHAEAEVAFLRTRTLDPDNLAVQANLGMATFFQGRFDEARAIFEEILTQRSDDVAALGGLGAIAIEQDDLARAEEMFQKALQIEPNHSLSRNGLEEVRRRQLN